MRTTDIDELCREVEAAAEVLREIAQREYGMSRTLNDLWRLQDQLARLVEVAEDSASEAAGLFGERHPGLVTRVTEALNDAVGRPSVPAVHASCKAINQLLASLQRPAQGLNRARTANA